MDTDKRRLPRFNPAGLMAHITLEPHTKGKGRSFEGTVIDMSYTGIKIKLNTPIIEDIPESEILITLNMPESGVPITIRGIIKHLTDDTECGLQYSNSREHDMDHILFECIKVAHNHTQSI